MLGVFGEDFAEGGVFGILLIIICVFVFGYYAFKYGNLIDKALFVYLVKSVEYYCLAIFCG